MSMNISGLGNAYSGVNTNSKQYKALKEKGWLEGVIQNEAMMSPEGKMIYEIFGGRDTIVNNLMKQFGLAAFTAAYIADLYCPSYCSKVHVPLKRLSLFTLN